MKCRKCQFENLAIMKFYREYDASLEIGPQTEQSKTSPIIKPERKHIPVLFSDLSGYTAMTEKLEPEQVKEITGSIFSGIKEIVARYGVFIERAVGDGVLAFFGVPLSHEARTTRFWNQAIKTSQQEAKINVQKKCLLQVSFRDRSDLERRIRSWQPLSDQAVLGDVWSTDA